MLKLSVEAEVGGKPWKVSSSAWSAEALAFGERRDDPSCSWSGRPSLGERAPAARARPRAGALGAIAPRSAVVDASSSATRSRRADRLGVFGRECGAVMLRKRFGSIAQATPRTASALRSPDRVHRRAHRRARGHGSSGPGRHDALFGLVFLVRCRAHRSEALRRSIPSARSAPTLSRRSASISTCSAVASSCAASSAPLCSSLSCAMSLRCRGVARRSSAAPSSHCEEAAFDAECGTRCQSASPIAACSATFRRTQPSVCAQREARRRRGERKRLHVCATP